MIERDEHNRIKVYITAPTGQRFVGRVCDWTLPTSKHAGVFHVGFPAKKPHAQFLADGVGIGLSDGWWLLDAEHARELKAEMMRQFEAVVMAELRNPRTVEQLKGCFADASKDQVRALLGSLQAQERIKKYGSAGRGEWIAAVALPPGAPSPQRSSGAT